jgi:phage terminase small subunit
MPAIGNIDELKLTQKQETFCLAYVETGNASEAYRRAYNAGKMKPESVNVNASKLMADAKISLRVAGLKADLVERHQITADDIAKMLREDRDFARECATPAAAVSATMGLAKLYGLITDRLSAQVTDSGPKTIVYRNAG